MSSFVNRVVLASRVCIYAGICLCLAGCGSSRESDIAEMERMSRKMSAAIDDGLNKGETQGTFEPRVIASWSCVLAREMAYVKGRPPEFAPRSPDEDHPRFYTTEEWKRMVRDTSLRADRKVHFDEGQYRSFLEGMLGKGDYAKIEAIRKRRQYFDKMKTDYN